MFKGTIDGIYISGEAAGALTAVESVEAVADRGLTGDRYFQGGGTFSKGKPDQQVTLIEAEALEAAKHGYDVVITPAESRRNLLTRGVPLNHLVGKRFRVGGAVIEGIRLCEPCGHLEKLTGKEAIKALRHRGGLRARIVEGGTISAGDEVSPT